MSETSLRILIFEEDEDHARHLRKILHGPGCETHVESSLYQATRRFKNAPFDLSIVNLDMPDDEGEELAWWLLENFPRRQVVLTGSEILPEQEDLLASKSVIGFFPAPVPQQVLAGVLRQSDRGLRGQVQRMQVLDLLQALRYSQKAITLMFDDAILQQEGWVYMQNGDIVHVEVYQRNPITRSRTLLASGHEAFDLMMSFKNGAFSEQVWQEPSERSVTLPFDGLMMNAAQKQDESLWTQADSIRIRKALLIDNEAMSRMMLQQGLLAEGIDCVSLRSLDMVSSSLQAQKSELLIIDSDLDHQEVVETLKWLKTYDPRCRVLLLGSPHWQDDLPMPCQILPRPISPKRLKEILFELTQVGFRGFLNRIGVLDFLQLNLSAIDESKKLHIRDLSNRVDGQIYIDRGRFVHAQFGELQGEEAFYRIAAIEKGDFFEDPSFQPPSQSLAETMPHKLMISAGRFVKPLDEPEPVASLSAAEHLGGVAAKMQASTESASAGALNLFGEEDLQDISLNLHESEAGGLTSLFGDDDEPPQIKLNLGQEPAEGGITSLFGDDDELPQFSLNLERTPESEPGGITSLFADDEKLEFKLPEPAGQIESLFADDEIQLNLGAEPASSLSSLVTEQTEPAQPVAPPAAPDTVTEPVLQTATPAQEPSAESKPATSKLDEMRARWAERRASIANQSMASPQGKVRTAPLANMSGAGALVSKTGSLTARPSVSPQPRPAPSLSAATTGPLQMPHQTESSGRTSLFSEDELDDLNFSLGS